MDGCRKLIVAGTFFVSGLVGCTSTKNSTTPLDIPPPPPTTKNSVYVPEPADDSAKKDGPLAASTIILVANMRVEAVAKDPNRPAADREANLKSARELYQNVLTREPRNVEALLGLGTLYQVSGEKDKLKEIEQRATSLHANNAKVWEWVAVRQAQAKNWEGASASYHQAVKLDPENRLYRIHLGFTLARNGRYAEGYEWLSRSMKESEARYNLAKAMLHNGEEDKAKMELRLSLRADPSFKAAGDQLATLQNSAPGERPTDIHTAGHQEPR